MYVHTYTWHMFTHVYMYAHVYNVLSLCSTRHFFNLCTHFFPLISFQANKSPFSAITRPQIGKSLVERTKSVRLVHPPFVLQMPWSCHFIPKYYQPRHPYCLKISFPVILDQNCWIHAMTQDNCMQIIQYADRFRGRSPSTSHRTVSSSSGKSDPVIRSEILVCRNRMLSALPIGMFRHFTTTAA